MIGVKSQMAFGCQSISRGANYLRYSSMGLLKKKITVLKHLTSGSGSGGLGKVVAFNIKDTRFESNHQQFYLLSTF